MWAVLGGFLVAVTLVVAVVLATRGGAPSHSSPSSTGISPPRATPSTPPSSDTSRWTEFHGNSAHSAGVADMPVPPLKLRWTFTGDRIVVPGQGLGPNHWFRGAFDPPVASNGVVVAVSDKAYGISLKSGHQQWSFSPPPGNAFYQPVIVGDQVVLAMLSGVPTQLTLIGLSVTTGKEQWRWTDDAAGARWVWLTTTGDGILAVASPGQGQMWLINADGTLRWSTTTESLVPPSQRPPPAVSDGTTVVVQTEAGLEAHAASDGRLLWSGAPGESGAVFSPALVGDRVIAATGDAVHSRVVIESLTTGEVTATLAGDMQWFAVTPTSIVVERTDGSYQTYTLDGLQLQASLELPFPAYIAPGSQLPLAGGIAFGGFAPDDRRSSLWYVGSDGNVWHGPTELPAPGFPGVQNTTGIAAVGNVVLVSSASGVLYAYGDPP